MSACLDELQLFDVALGALDPDGPEARHVGECALCASGARMIAEGLQDGEGVAITVKGPENLFEQLKARFEEPAPVFRHVETQDVDLTVEYGDTVLVTRMAAWADTVRKVLA